MMDTGKELKYINVENSSSGEKLNMNISKSKYLLFVISFDACNTCIWQELEKIKKITTEISEKIKTLYIYYGDSKINALRFKKFMPSRDSIFISIDNQLDSINYSKKYPYILLIKNGIVCDAHFPIPGDTTFSNLFYKRIKEKI